MFRALKSSLQLRIRQLWAQCDLFEAQPEPQAEVLRPAAPHSGRLPASSPPTSGPRGEAALPDRGTESRNPRVGRLPAGPFGHAVRGRAPRMPKSHPQDRQWVERLTEAYNRYNAELFGNTLSPVGIRVSRRMKNRLGHYMLATSNGLPPEIAISRQHLKRDPWDEVLHTLVHEMVHQWQDENGLPVDHGQHFRRKATEVGIRPRATRTVNEYLSPHGFSD